MYYFSFNWHIQLRVDMCKVSKPPAESSYSWLIGMTSTLVCISGPSTGCGALMRGKFVLAKHGQIYEPARLSSFALTTDINIRTLQGDCITWGIGTLPTWLCVRRQFHREWAQMMHFTNHGWLISVSFYWWFIHFDMATVIVMCQLAPAHQQ